MRNLRTTVSAFTCGLVMLVQQVAAGQHVQLTRIEARLSSIGYEQTHERSTGRLRNQESTTFRVWLQGGTQYSIRGTCDLDCADLDLELRSADGSLVDRDFQRNDVPVVSVRPAVPGYYNVRVVMARCSLEPCEYAVGTFGLR
jgi:hypothetical protein